MSARSATARPASTRTLAAKILAPPPSGSGLPRPALEQRLDEVLDRRLGLVVANAGFGKSTLLAAWAARVRSCWYTLTPEDAALGSLARGLVDALRLRVPGLPTEIAAAVAGSRGPDAAADEDARAQAFAASLCNALHERLPRDLVLVLDDLHEAGEAPSARRLVEGLCRHAPPTLHLVLSSRSEPPFPIERLRGAGQVVEIAGSDLAFAPEEVVALLAEALDEDDPDLGRSIHDVTGGWPAAIRLAIEALRGVPPAERRQALERARQPGGQLYAYLAAEVFAREPADVRELVRMVAPLEGFTPELCEALGVHGAAETLASLARRGLFLELYGSHVGWFSLTALVRDFAAARLTLTSGERRELQSRAAAWYEAHGHAEAALHSLAAIGEDVGIARVLSRHGRSLLADGSPEAVIAAAEQLPQETRDAEIERLVGEAHQLRGDWEAALAAFGRAAGDSEDLDPALAWRMGLIHHLRGELDEALEVYGRGSLGGGAPAEEALLLAWTASALWLRGDRDGCAEKGSRAFELAVACGDSQALAAAHTVAALLAALEGDRSANDAHYLRALDHAERADDVLQLIRIHTNRGSLHCEEGDYEEALAELEAAIRLADLGGFASFRALALSNRGEVKFHLGRLEEAIADLEAARALYQRAGSRMVAYPLAKLGDLYRERGDLSLARAAYEEAAARSREAEDLQGLVPALAGLARVLAAEEPGDARRFAEQAVAYGPGMAYVGALLASGWVALHGGDRDAANGAAVAAAAAARERRDRPGLAEALELQGATASDADTAVARLEEARSIWRDLRHALGEARTELALARVSSPEVARDLAGRAGHRLRELGSRGHAAAAARLVADLGREGEAGLEIRTLGRFAVLRGGEPVPPAEWQSKKARELLKILLARRGSPTPREMLMELLWPDGDPGKLGNRLSVALATVRTVLDPGKRVARDRFIVADKSSVALRLEALSVDVERFLAAATGGLAKRHNGARPEAADLLASAEAAYTGEFLEEDLYEDWAASLREEARAAYVGVARALAEDARAAGDAATATKYLLRLLDRDAYDERAHIELVSALAEAGRHGEAHRFYRAYGARMEEIGVEPAPFPALSAR